MSSRPEDLLQEGIDFFNAGRYFEAHESWEDLWRATAGEPRAFYQGLVQAAVGLHHLSRGNLQGGRRVLRRGLEKIESFGDEYMGIDNAGLIGQLRAVVERSDGHGIRIDRETGTWPADPATTTGA